ncbi:inositol monophosphatase family protein [Paenibacillus filicis]|uniref:Inositol-1-monophosphatase n=1 Tax=Paenibacillus gyeongsangnamensis TaxID=3388067 RepID=A0ABT4QIB4_9BACL|nr:inositol monophosphatase family protein [Paenibacillus filicis]MCZ8516631.1 inositol monophosphatase family protein [Paenibacillus filicis]
MMNQASEAALLQSAIEYAKQAGDLIRGRVGNLGNIQEKKNGSDLVTQVDMLSESFLRGHILKDYSDHWILSEEDNGTLNSYEALQKKGPGLGWIIDPIDGTTNFIHEIPHFAVSIGIVRDQEPFIGVVYNPLTNELFHARKHFGAFRNGEPIQAGKQKQLSEALLAAGFQAEEWGPNSNVLHQMDKLAGTCRNLRMNGAASLDLCWVAMGRLTGFWHNGLHPWDTAAGVLIVREAGGQVTDNHGNSYQLHHDTLVASNGKIHSEFLSGIEI